MVEYLVTKGKLVVRNSEPLVVVDGDEKALSKSEFILWTSLHWNVMNKESLETEFNKRTKYSITRVFYTTRENMKTYKPKAGDEITFRLTVRNKSTGEIKDYIFTEELKLPYEIEKYFE